MEKILVLAGDAAEDLDAMYPIYRLREAGYEVHVAAPTRRKVKLVVHDFEEAPDVVDGNIVSCTGWPDLPEFSRAFMSVLERTAVSS
jgi:putative intracellular protease/amidase